MCARTSTAAKKLRMWACSVGSFPNLQKLLNDKDSMKNTVSSETTHQACQEPLKDEEHTKLRDLLKQRDNEINILSGLELGEHVDSPLLALWCACVPKCPSLSQPASH